MTQDEAKEKASLPEGVTIGPRMSEADSRAFAKQRKLEENAKDFANEFGCADLREMYLKIGSDAVFAHRVFDRLLEDRFGVPQEQAEEQAEAPGSGSARSGGSDWTEAGQNFEGFPVAKGSPEDVTAE